MDGEVDRLVNTDVKATWAANTPIAQEFGALQQT